MTRNRKIIQILRIQSSNWMETSDASYLVLCNDGTVWSYKPRNKEWTRRKDFDDLPDIQTWKPTGTMSE